MRDMYVTPGIDGDKIRAEARDVSRGDNYNRPEPVLIHEHSSTTKCMDAGPHSTYVDGQLKEQW